MIINEDVYCFGHNIILVPYEQHHVEKYHEWMLSPELQELTASEPLTLDEEYKMQQKWRQDEDKCTFIILDARLYDNSKGLIDNKEVGAMIGDVNLFFNDLEDKATAEIEVMIAETASRGKGLGKQALLTMMRYGAEILHLTSVSAKIGFSNTPSLSMFKKIGFIEVSLSEVFQEATLEIKFEEQFKNFLMQETPDFCIVKKTHALKADND